MPDSLVGKKGANHAQCLRDVLLVLALEDEEVVLDVVSVDPDLASLPDAVQSGFRNGVFGVDLATAAFWKSKADLPTREERSVSSSSA